MKSADLGIAQHWVWVTGPHCYANPDGSDRDDLDPAAGYVPDDGWWRCHKDTREGDQVLLYRTRPRMDIAYRIEARSDAYPVRVEPGQRGGKYGCDYEVLEKFADPMTLGEISADTALAGQVLLAHRHVRMPRVSGGRGKVGLCSGLLVQLGLVDPARAELGEKRLDAVAGGGVAFDLSVPSAAGGVVDELLLDGHAHAEPGCVVAGGEELRACEHEVAFARAFGGCRRQWPSSRSVLRKLVCSQDTASGSRRCSRNASAAGPARVTSGPRWRSRASWYCCLTVGSNRLA